jgi:hypothetical protein
MNPIIVTIVVATATFILSIFGALQFYSSRMEKYIDAKVEGLRAEIATSRAEVKGEIGEMRAEMRAQGERLARVERQLEALFVPKPMPPGRGD